MRELANHMHKRQQKSRRRRSKSEVDLSEQSEDVGLVYITQQIDCHNIFACSLRFYLHANLKGIVEPYKSSTEIMF